MTSPPTAPDTERRGFDWKDSPSSANVWLAFLAFPLLSVLFSDRGTAIKVAVSALILVFALVHVLGYRAAALRGRGGVDSADLPFADELSPVPYFLAMIAIQAVSLLVAGNGLLGLLPFIVVYAIFNFTWRVAGVVGAASLAAVIALPLVAGQLSIFWFFTVLILSVGAAASFARLGEENLIDQAALQTNLAVSDERNRVARDVHDVLGHSLTAVILKTQVCARLVESIEGANESDRAALSKVKAELAELDAVSRRAMGEVRSTVGGLRVAALAEEVAAARSVLADASVELSVRGSADRVRPEHQALLAWVVRESVTNIVRHAQAESCSIELLDLENNPVGTLIRIIDDGVGLGPDSGRPEFDRNGLRGMRERVEAAGACLVTGSGPNGCGTAIEVSI